MPQEASVRADRRRPPAPRTLWQACAVGIVVGAAAAVLAMPAVDRVRALLNVGLTRTAPAVAASSSASGPYYVVVEKHYLDLGTSDDAVNWFFGTVRNDGNARGTCNVIAYFFDEDDRSIEASVVPIKPLDPGQLATFHVHPTVQNAESAGVKFTGDCGHGIMWHYKP